MYDPQAEPDLIEFENVDLCDEKYVEGPKFRNRRTSIFVTFADPSIALVDVQKMMETGMNIARFKTSHSTTGDKVRLLKKFDKAANILAAKYGLLYWPCATCIELKTCVANTGILEEDAFEIHIREGTDIIMTSDVQMYNKCNAENIFVDNPYLTSDVKVGMLINIAADEIITKCTAILNNKNIKCHVVKGGQLQNMAHVCMRGAKRTRPYLTKADLHIIKFAVEYQVDMIIINYARHVDTVKKIKRYLGSKVKRPIIVAGLCSEQGIDNVDSIIREADAILLSREFASYEVPMHLYHKMSLVQSYIAAKCRQVGKPFYLSGEIFKNALNTGVFHAREFSDVTNAILQGTSALVLGPSANVDYLMAVMRTINDLCASVEPLTNDRGEFFRNVSQLKMPLNAAEACAVSCTFIANQTKSRIIVCPTVNGRTTYLLNWLRPPHVIIAVTTKIRTVRILCTQRSVIALLYKGAPRRNWFRSVQARIDYAIQYAVENHWIQYGDHYVTLEKGTEASPFCDCVRVWTVTTVKKNTIECPESYHDFALNDYLEIPPIQKRSPAVKKRSISDAFKDQDLDTILAEVLQRTAEDEKHKTYIESF
ncbi:pyruvate kinase-like [Trichoplusia ni]|uniref:Pyruvate kinase n=1 Tax=Trichoplusia ni TaxID=7111 RepID=A0A7E5WA45_TRINI|nr:pyruvate kinase-like [Trichoplusia ni]